MARATVVTDVSLDQFSIIMGIHPTLFNGLMAPGVLSNDTVSRPFIYQYDWQQHNMLGWETIARGIEQAEGALSRHLGWYPRPRFITNEVAWNVEMFHKISQGYDAINGARKDMALGWGKVHAGGVETYTDLDTNATITWSDQDNDTIKETWSVVITDSTTTDFSEVGAYFKASDRVDDLDLSEKWRIRPVIIRRTSATQLTITGRRWIITKPAITEQLNPNLDAGGIDLDTDSNFPTALHIARHHADNTESHVSLLWDDGSVQSGYVEQVGENYVIPYPGTYSDGAWTKSGLTYPDLNLRQLTVSYCAGYPADAYGNVQSELATVISHFAVGFMSRDLGATHPYEKQWRFYTEDMTTMQRALPYHPDEFNNPFGTWRGAMEAWRFVKGVENTKYGK